MQPLLDRIQSPKALHKMDLPTLERLAAECRERIIATTSKRGGHLASNLGMVELSLAIAKVFDFDAEKARIIFDVGHQCYTWKLLTGRAEAFDTLRSKGGLSGFPKREESAFDYFNTGHSSTSISACLGFARADALRGKKRHNMAVIGDGAMTGGMAFEAMNDAGQGQDDVLIILNDNQMSIDENVGGLSKHLGRIRVAPWYQKLKLRAKEALLHLPLFGKPLYRMFQALKQQARQWQRESGSFFESLGLRYYGPVDGHDLDALIVHLRAMEHYQGPKLLHVLSQKGQGYPYAVEAPEAYHGVGRFEPSEGHQAKPQASFTSLAGTLLLKEAQADDRVIAITAAMMQGTGLEAFAKAFPERFFDVGIAEQHAVTFAAAMAASGMRAYLALYSTFMQRAMDQIIHDVFLQNLPVTFLLDHAGVVSDDGETHQGHFDLGLLSALPNLRIYSPADAKDLALAFEASAKAEGPVFIRYPKEPLPAPLPLADADRHLDQLRCLRQGKDLCLICHGVMAHAGLAAAERLANCQVEAGIYSAISSKLYKNDAMIEAAKQAGHCVFIDEVAPARDLRTQSLEVLMEASTAAVQFHSLGIRDCLAGQAKRYERLAAEGLDVDGIVRACLEALKRTDPRVLDEETG